MNSALLIVDMTNEFVHGRLSTREAVSIIEPIKLVLDTFRKKRYPIIFLKDSHFENDFELKIWGKHSMHGDKSSEIIDELEPRDNEYILEKHSYSGFFGTPLDSMLRSLNVSQVYLAGLDADICVRHTAADAFFRGYGIVVIRECIAAYLDKEWESYFSRVYGAKIISVEEFIKSEDQGNTASVINSTG